MREAIAGFGGDPDHSGRPLDGGGCWVMRGSHRAGTGPGGRDLPVGVVRDRRPGALLAHFQGVAGHAGTVRWTGVATLVAAPFIETVEGYANGTRAGATVGQLTVEPGAPRDPGRVTLSLDVRQRWMTRSIGSRSLLDIASDSGSTAHLSRSRKVSEHRRSNAIHNSSP